MRYQRLFNYYFTNLLNMRVPGKYYFSSAVWTKLYIYFLEFFKLLLDLKFFEYLNFISYLGDICIVFIKNSRHQLEIWWWQIELSGDALTEPLNGYLWPWNRQLMPLNFLIQCSYLHSNIIMCIYLNFHIIDKMT